MKKKKNFRKLSRKISQTPGLDIDNFEKTCIDLLGLCRIIKDQNDTNQSLLKNFIKIRLVSIVEFNLKGFISSLIDNQDLKPNEILDDDSIIIDVDVLQNIKSDEYTKGKIIVAHLDKMNAEIISDMMNKINRLDAFKWFDKLLSYEKNTFWKSFKDLYRERNDLTHNLIDTEDSISTLSMRIQIINHNIYALYVFTNLNLDIFTHGFAQSSIEQKYENQLNKLNLDYQKFKDITTKFRKDYKPSYKKY